MTEDQLLIACENGNINLVNEIISSGAYYNYYIWNIGLKKACKGGNIEIVNLMISKRAYYWNWGLEGACEGGHIDIIKLLISKDKDNFNLNWDHGLYGACKSGQLNTAKLMIQLGADDFNLCIGIAIKFGHMDILKFIILKGYNFYDDYYGNHNTRRAHKDCILLRNLRNIYKNGPVFQAYKQKLQQYFTTIDFRDVVLSLGTKGNLGRITAQGTGIIAKVIEMNL